MRLAARQEPHRRPVPPVERAGRGRATPRRPRRPPPARGTASRPGCARPPRAGGYCGPTPARAVGLRRPVAAGSRVAPLARPVPGRSPSIDVEGSRSDQCATARAVTAAASTQRASASSRRAPPRGTAPRRAWKRRQRPSAAATWRWSPRRASHPPASFDTRLRARVRRAPATTSALRRPDGIPRATRFAPRASLADAGAPLRQCIIGHGVCSLRWRSIAPTKASGAPHGRAPASSARSSGGRGAKARGSSRQRRSSAPTCLQPPTSPTGHEHGPRPRRRGRGGAYVVDVPGSILRAARGATSLRRVESRRPRWRLSRARSRLRGAHPEDGACSR